MKTRNIGKTNIYDVVGFDKRLVIRLSEEQLKEIKKLCLIFDDAYKTPSHFVRVAIIKEIRARGAMLEGLKRDFYKDINKQNRGFKN